MTVSMLTARLGLIEIGTEVFVDVDSKEQRAATT
jgi:hypothetical protein